MADDGERWRRNLTLLVTGNAVSSFGNAIYLVAMVLFLKEIGASATILGLFQFLALIPGFLLSPITGYIIDQRSRRGILVLADGLRGVLMVMVAFLLAIPTFRIPAVILLLSLGSGLGHAFFVPAAQAMIPQIVPERALARANGLRAGGSQLFNMAGNAVGGLLFTLLGAPIVLAINGATFLISAVQEMWIDEPGLTGRVQTAQSGTTIFGQLRDSFRLLRTRPRLRSRILSQGGMFLLSPVFILPLPFILIDDLAVDGAVLGYLMAISLAGGIVAFVLLSRISTESMVALPLIPGAYALFALLFGVMGVLRTLPVLAVGAFVAGAAAAGVYLSVTTEIQRGAPGPYHGRLFALMEALSAGVAPVAYLLVGLLLDSLGPGGYRLLFWSAAAVSLLWAVRLVMLPERG